MRHLEDSECTALIAWASVTKYGAGTIATYLFHYPAGGKRNAREAARLKRMGVRPGIPDYFLHVAIPPFNGAFVEMKRPGGGRVSKAQAEQMKLLKACGYYVPEPCHGWIEAATMICCYLGLKQSLVQR